MTARKRAPSIIHRRTRTTMRIRLIGTALCAGALLLAACGSEPPRPTVSVSVGQQLIDLKQARDSGALSSREYESQKEQLIRNVE
jgi:hypothetical protein